jgi:hypothetical protein
VGAESASKIGDKVSMTVQIVVRNALRFQRAGRRKHMIVDDIDAAIRYFLFLQWSHQQHIVIISIYSFYCLSFCL